METVDAASGTVDERQDDKDLDDETCTGCEAQNVVDGTYVEHDDHAAEEGVYREAEWVTELAAAEQAGKEANDDTKEDGNASHDGSSCTLELTGVGYVDDVLVDGDV